MHREKVGNMASIVVAGLSEAQGRLFKEESEHSSKWTQMRQKEFRGGRCVAREAMRLAVGLNSPIGVGQEGEPIWPKDVCGSISHTSSHAAAIVSDATEFLSVGIDINDKRELGDALLRKVATPKEIAVVKEYGLPSANVDVGNFIFSLKEAFYKCQFRLTQIADLTFQEVSVEPSVDSGLRLISPRAFEHLPSQTLQLQLVRASLILDQLVIWVSWPAH